jgi:DNA-binding NarL/FixJ family response regulator
MKVLIVDDHPIVHAGLRRLIAVEPAADLIRVAIEHQISVRSAA